MLQQTQVMSVIPFYQRWLRRFPTVGALASARETDVLHAWQGLGYYSRARNLHSAAKQIVRQHDGILPSDPDEIRCLPGMGRYSANAVATFAFNKSVPIVEANITRLLSRLFDIRVPVDSLAGRERLWQAAESLVPDDEPARFNSALMDLGALICLKQPRCDMCPVRSFCLATRPQSLPLKKPRPKTVHLTESHAFVRQKGRILLEKCSGRWRGMWMLPSIPTPPTGKQPVHSAVFPFTHHRVNLRVYRHHVAALSPHRWTTIDELGRLPIPSPHRRAIVACLPLDVER